MIEIPHGWMYLWKIKLSGKVKCTKHVKNGFTENSHIELQDPTNAVTEVINTRKQ